MNVDKQTVENFIVDQSWEYREVGDEFQIISGCPVCKDSGPVHFYINQNTGQYHCHRCNAGGSLYTLMKEMGKLPKKDSSFINKKTLKKSSIDIQPNFDLKEEDIENFNKALLQNARVMKWFLEERGIKEETLKHFKIGWDGRRIIIPIYFKGKLLTVRYRKDPDDQTKAPKYMSHPGSDTVLFNADCLEQKIKGTAIVEGELDLMVFWQEVNPAVVTSTGGCMTFKDEWVEMFTGIHRVNICLDNDEAGRKGAEMIAKKLGWFRCWDIVLPKQDSEKKKDISDFFNVDNRNRNDLLQLFRTAKRFPELTDEKITPMYDIVDIARENMVKGKKIRGMITGHDDLDYTMEGMLPGDLVILSGQTGVGKTLTAQSFAMNMLNAGKEVMFFSLEMLPSELAQRFIMINTQIPMEKYAGFARQSRLDANDERRLDSTISKLKNMPLYFYTGQDKLDFNLLDEVSTRAVRKYNSQIIFIDHLHYFARGNAQNRSVDIGDLVRDIKLLARKLNIPIVLISHLRKIGDYKTEPTIDDLRDTSFSGQDADVVLLLQRDKLNDDKDERQKMTMIIAKNRHGREDKIKFVFMRDNMRLIEESALARMGQSAPPPIQEPEQINQQPLISGKVDKILENKNVH